MDEIVTNDVGFLMRRRKFIIHLSRLVVAVSAARWSLSAYSSSVAVVSEQVDQKTLRATLSELAYLLLPLQPSGADAYHAVAEKLIMQAINNPAIEKILLNGMQALNQTGENPWLAAQRSTRKKVMSELMLTPFMGLVRWVTHEVVLRNKQIWGQLGYQGSAIEHGGYLTRGFNDISWLPSQSGEGGNGEF